MVLNLIMIMIINIKHTRSQVGQVNYVRQNPWYFAAQRGLDTS